MASKVTVAVSKGRRKPLRLLLCLFLVEAVTLLVLAQLSGGDMFSALSEIAAFVAP